MNAEELYMLSRRVPLSLWQRFRSFCENYTPRTSDTAMIVRALTEFLDRHEPKPAKGAKR